MDSTNGMSIEEIFNRLKEKVGNIIEIKKKTEGMRNTKSQTQKILDLITYSQSISATALEDNVSEFNLFQEICEVLMEEPPSVLSTIIIKTIILRLKTFNQLNTLIRSARKITKKNQLAYNFQITLQKLLDEYQKIIKAMETHQTTTIQVRNDIIPNSVKLTEIEGYSFYTPVKYYCRLGSTGEKWFNIHLEKSTKFLFTIPKQGYHVKLFPNLDKEQIILFEIVKSPDFSTLTYSLLQILQKQDLTEEFEKISPDLLWVFSKIGFMREIPEKIRLKEIKTNLKRLISNAYFEIVTELFRNTKYEHVVDEPLKILSRIALVCENGIQEELQNLGISGDQMGKEYQNRISPILEKFVIIRNWLESLKTFLKPYDTITEKFEEIIDDLTIEINRKQQEFEDYSETLYEHDARASVDQELDEILQVLDDKITSYEKTTLRLVEEEIPQIKQISDIINNFQQDFDHIYSQAQSMFKNYQEDKINIYDAVNRWEETYFAEKNRAEFIVSKMLSVLLEKFHNILKKEQDFMQASSEVGLDKKNLSLMLSPNVLNPDTLTDDQLRNQMKYIDKKLLDLEEMKSFYTQTKISYKSLLERRLEKKGDITSKICVICHKEVDVVSDEYIRCEFCGRLAHYLCNAWWLERYNSCPVCGNVYLQPGSELYDSDKVEKE